MTRLTRVTAFALLPLLLAGGGAAVQLSRPLPALVVSVVPPPPPALAPPPLPVETPAQGSISLSDGTGAGLASLDADHTRPIGSVAKTMTALVVLESHPLTGDDGQGPTLTMTASDVAIYRDTIAKDGSSLAIVEGEALTERQLLLALMLPSANNIAETLGVWVAGTRDAFVARLNARAAALGMHGTHFADPSGYDPATQSTAADLVKLGRAALANASLAAVVSTRTTTLPDGTVLNNLDALLATEPGWLGIKTGETPSAGGCLLFAVRRAVPGGSDTVTMVGAVLGQRGLSGALQGARDAVRSAYAGYTDVVWAAHAPPVDGEVIAAWGSSSRLRVSAPHGAASTPLRAGDQVTFRVTRLDVIAPLPAGTTVAAAHVLVDGAEVATWDVQTTVPLDAAPTLWHIMHG